MGDGTTREALAVRRWAQVHGGRARESVETAALEVLATASRTDMLSLT